MTLQHFQSLRRRPSQSLTGYDETSKRITGGYYPPRIASAIALLFAVYRLAVGGYPLSRRRYTVAVRKSTGGGCRGAVLTGRRSVTPLPVAVYTFAAVSLRAAVAVVAVKSMTAAAVVARGNCPPFAPFRLGAAVAVVAWLWLLPSAIAAAVARFVVAAFVAVHCPRAAAKMATVRPL